MDASKLDITLTNIASFGSAAPVPSRRRSSSFLYLTTIENVREMESLQETGRLGRLGYRGRPEDPNQAMDGYVPTIVNIWYYFT